MKKRIIPIILIAAVCILSLCAFKIDTSSSIKSLTHPYINSYECIFATLGGDDFLDDYEYIRINILDAKELEVSFKKINGKKHSYKTNYTCDDQTGELEAEIGILGFRFKQKTKIRNGKFVLSMPILTKQLIMKFAVAG